MNSGDLELKCPHCNEYFIVNKNEINCGIFRHAVLRTNNLPINPHETKENCDNMVVNGMVYGCAKPFKITQTIGENMTSQYIVEICDYI